ncbi:myelocytomatosis oncogene homolog isoform X2 [Stegostoma tigrinum]|uniref:myelocytomatosis oncogene homolog isoform X2 n=1 Tax=Stegostoma tigrinum TaxID=3053191 RepID=UPI00202AC9E7|nr:myelocytomatosis oncogene homolog isoform X2 [Stegostoma tigrinum]
MVCQLVCSMPWPVKRLLTMPQSGNISCDFQIFSSLLEEEDFYQTCEEFLKTVEMLPASPQSPLPKSNICDSLSSLIPSKSDQLELMSEFLLDDEEFISQSLICDLEASLKMEQDCMWNNLLGSTELDKVGDKLDALPVSSPLMSEIESHFFQDICSSDFETISPFLERPQQNRDNPNSDDESSLSTGSVFSHCTDSEEEIDVVSIEKQRLAEGSVIKQEMPRPGTRSQTLASIKQCSLEIQQQHNYAAPSPLLSRDLPAPKRAKTDNYLHAAKYSLPNRSSAFSLKSPDAEDEERRRTHNVLERQRRNELKHCLLALRDEVPELSKNDKASKVVILRKATEYVIKLKAEHQKLNTEREKLQKKQQQLRRKIEQMQRFSK